MSDGTCHIGGEGGGGTHAYEDISRVCRRTRADRWMSQWDGGHIPSRPGAGAVPRDGQLIDDRLVSQQAPECKSRGRILDNDARSRWHSPVDLVVV